MFFCSSILTVSIITAAPLLKRWLNICFDSFNALVNNVAECEREERDSLQPDLIHRQDHVEVKSCAIIGLKSSQYPESNHL